MIAISAVIAFPERLRTPLKFKFDLILARERGTLES